MDEIIDRRVTEFDLRDPDKTHGSVSTLLIPVKTVSCLERYHSLKELPGILSRLLLKYRNLALSETLDASEKVQTLYQDKGQGLVKKSFRPIGEDWIQLSILAHGLGISRCLLFVTLLMLELDSMAQSIENGEETRVLGVHTSAQKNRLRCLLELIDHDGACRFVRVLENTS
ncbi:MAG: DUF1564 family protein [Leptospiraceae bacterium]|nr:DUF1564 family protein [Leptospiraceae bacterium]